MNDKQCSMASGLGLHCLFRLVCAMLRVDMVKCKLIRTSPRYACVNSEVRLVCVLRITTIMSANR